MPAFSRGNGSKETDAHSREKKRLPGPVTIPKSGYQVHPINGGKGEQEDDLLNFERRRPSHGSILLKQFQAEPFFIMKP